MNPPSELVATLGTVLGALFVALIAVANYLRTKEKPQQQSTAVLTGIGLAFGDKLQTEELIKQVTRIANGIDVLADRRTDDMADMQKELIERMDRAEAREQGRRTPVRRK